MSPCRVIPNGFVCTRGERPMRCCICDRPAHRLCDFPTVPLAFGEPVQTCDRALCDVHATRVSRDQDYCPEHATAVRVR